MSSRLGNLNRLLEDKAIATLLGQESIKLIRTVVRRADKSFRFRDDLVHGHHLAGWHEPTVHRVPGKQLEKGRGQFIKLSATKTKRHANVILGAAAVVALLDHYFDDAYNGA